MVSILAKKLLSEITNPLNAGFRSDLEAMLKKCDDGLKLLLKNEFLVVSSLLDPRFTIQMEALLNNQFRDYLPAIVKLIKSFKNEEMLDEQLESTMSPDHISDDHQQYDFWKEFGHQSILSSQLTSKREFEDQLEVSLILKNHNAL